MLVKYIVIDHKKRVFGTYSKRVYEVELDTEERDLGVLGKLIHDDEYGATEKRHFVKVLGAEEA